LSVTLTDKEIAEINEKLADGKSLKEIATDRNEDYQTLYQRLRFTGLVLKTDKRQRLVWRRDLENDNAAA
jgi:predicted DNA-binding protein YlxM (UPF0122 family)